MAVEIYVSSEELKKTLEYVALIGGNMASGKKQDDDLKQMAGALRIVAVSPHEDNNYMLMFCRAGAADQRRTAFHRLRPHRPFGQFRQIRAGQRDAVTRRSGQGQR